MAVSVDQFWKALLNSGLLTAEEAQALWNTIPADECPVDGDTLAAWLRDHGTLNDFQARELLSGGSSPLVVGDYVLLAKIGAGGMGQVFKAQHRQLKRFAAVKALPASDRGNATAVKRFQREVVAAGRLAHPNIVATYDAREQAGARYLVMEFVDGIDLARLVRTHGRLPVDQAVSCIRQAARGLEHAHAQGLVHRDIKPGNLMLDRRGVVKILDLGLARFDDAVRETSEEQLTESQFILGTVDYMAPEQALDVKHADARADIYGLGCTLYFLLTGGTPYGGGSTMQKLLAHREATIPALRSSRPEVPPELEVVYRRMVSKRPEDRYQTMAEVGRALDPFLPADHDALGATEQFVPADPGPSNRAANPSSNPSRPVEAQQACGSQRSARNLRRVAVPVAVVAVLLAVAALWRSPWVRNGIDDRQAVIPAAASAMGPAGEPAAAPAADHALAFDGQSAYVALPRYDVEPIRTLTIEAWILRRRSGELESIVSNAESAGFDLSSARDGRFLFLLHGATEFHRIQTNDPVPIGRWFHLAAVFDGTEIRLYVDGRRQRKTAPIALPVRASDLSVFIGANPTPDHAPSQPSADLLEEIRISTAARYTDDFTAERRLEADPETWALYRCDDGVGTQLTDASGHGRHGRIVGARWTPVGPVPPAAPNSTP